MMRTSRYDLINNDMVIKNKDGSVYKLQSPNPLTEEQVWEFGEDDYILHNMDWEPDVDEDATPEVVPKESDFNEPKEEKPVEEVKAQEEEAKPVEIEERKDVRSEVPKNVLDKMVVMHCVPMETRVEKDDFYDEERTTTGFGQKFTLEAVIVKREDYEMRFWTTKDLSKGTIVFPSKYVSGVKYSEYRWWKVQARIPKANGFLVSTIPSEEQPDFS